MEFKQHEDALAFFASLDPSEAISIAKTYGLKQNELSALIDKRTELQAEIAQIMHQYDVQISGITEEIENLCEHEFDRRFLYDDDDGWSRRDVTYTYQLTCKCCGYTKLEDRK